MTRRKRYSAEFKRQALRRADEPGVTDTLVAEEIGVSTRQLRRWRDTLKQDGEAAFPGQGVALGSGTGEAETRTRQGKTGTGFFSRSGKVLCQGIEVRYDRIFRCRQNYPVRMTCRLLQVSRSGYYAWCTREDSVRVKRDRALSASTVIYRNKNFFSRRFW